MRTPFVILVSLLGVYALSKDLPNIDSVLALYRDQPALHELDFDGRGFRWIDCKDSDQSVFAFLRLSEDGRKQLVIYGRAEGITDDPERAELTARVFRKLTGNPDVAVDDSFIAALDEQKRTVLRITPEKASIND